MSYTVLVADDEPIMRKAMQTLIRWEDLGCELVDVVSDGEDVINLLKQKKYDILILDIHMPVLTGLEVAAYVWENHLDSKVILLTAYADFSYAQAAIKYDVVDYVAKAGAFEGLEAAVEKAKTKIEKSRSLEIEENKEIFQENFFKSIFDGTEYQAEVLIQKAQKLKLDIFEGFTVITIRFHLDKNRARDYVERSLKNFLQAVLEDYLIFSMAIKENTMVAILTDKQNKNNALQEKYEQIVEMMDNFMKLHVYIGISQRYFEVVDLKRAFDEAINVMEVSAFYETSKINRYVGVNKEKKTYLEDTEHYLNEIIFGIKKGDVCHALNHFHYLLQIFKDNNGSIHDIQDVGIRIKAFVEKYLLEYDVTLYDITDFEQDISRLFFECRQIREYSEMMESIIKATSGYVSSYLNRRGTLIFEVEKYIDENFEKNITVSEIARSIGVSLSYLSRVYKEQTGMTLIQFINEKKLEKAKQYLCETDYKVYEIADLLGFENATYFSSFFKKNTGVSPKEYGDSIKREDI